MSELSDLVAAPVLYNLNGRTLEICPLTDGDYGGLLRFVQYLDWYELKQVEGVPPEVVAETLQNCIKTKVHMASQAFGNGLDTPSGLKEVAYLSLLHKHPELTRQEISGWNITDVASIASIASTISSVDEVESDEVKKNKVRVLEKLITQGKLLKSIKAS